MRESKKRIKDSYNIIPAYSSGVLCDYIFEKKLGW